MRRRRRKEEAGGAEEGGEEFQFFMHGVLIWQVLVELTPPLRWGGGRGREG